MEIKFNDVDFIYNKNTEIANKVLSNINLEIEESKITSIIGRSGSGKTTLVEMINLLKKPNSGTITVDKFEINNKTKKIKNVNDLRKNIGLIFQFPEEQFFNMTVYDEISFGLKSLNVKHKNLEKKILDSLKMVGLDKEYLYKNPFTLSNGEKRKIAIASILIYNPKILIFDEPTIGLDSLSKKNLIQLIRTLKMKYKKTIIIISHDIEIVHQISDRVILMNNGEIILNSDKYSVFKNDKILKKCGITQPKAIQFTNLVYKKTGKKIGYRDDINDIIKDVYRNVR